MTGDSRAGGASPVALPRARSKARIAATSGVPPSAGSRASPVQPGRTAGRRAAARPRDRAQPLDGLGFLPFRHGLGGIPRRRPEVFPRAGTAHSHPPVPSRQAAPSSLIMLSVYCVRSACPRSLCLPPLASGRLHAPSSLLARRCAPRSSVQTARRPSTRGEGGRLGGFFGGRWRGGLGGASPHVSHW